jgi:hypothetical protein
MSNPYRSEIDRVEAACYDALMCNTLPASENYKILKRLKGRLDALPTARVTETVDYFRGLTFRHPVGLKIRFIPPAYGASRFGYWVPRWVVSRVCTNFAGFETVVTFVVRPWFGGRLKRYSFY